jgi:hypothetical protein
MEDNQQNNRNELSLRTRYEASSSLTNSQAAIVQFYGKDFLKDVCPQFPSKDREGFYPSLSSAVEDNAAPTLVTVDNIYGQGASEMWLQVQITEVLMFTGIRDKMTQGQKAALARQLRRMGYHLKLSEMMQFFSRFEQGYYLSFKGYERPNPQVITGSFTMFLEDLMQEREYYEKKRMQQQQEEEIKRWNKEAVPCPEHIKKKLERLNQKFNTDVRLSEE